MWVAQKVEIEGKELLGEAVIGVLAREMVIAWAKRREAELVVVVGEKRRCYWCCLTRSCSHRPHQTTP